MESKGEQMPLRRAKSNGGNKRATIRTKVFIAMPFARRFNPVYEDVIRPALQEIGCNVDRVDEVYKSTPIIRDIELGIQKADIFVADLSERNPNVLYELGYARGIGRPLVLITQKIRDVPFDLQHRRCFLYSSSFRGKNKLVEDLQQAVSETRAAHGFE